MRPDFERGNCGENCPYYRSNYCGNVSATETGDVKASIAVVSFILSNATKFTVDADSLSNELQQLGLPKGSSTLYTAQSVNVGNIAVRSVTSPHRYGNSHAIWDHTVLPATRQT